MEIGGLVEQVQAAFGWDDIVDVSSGPRGALGQIWRFQVGSERYAVKEIFDEAPTESSIAVELGFAERARAEGSACAVGTGGFPGSRVRSYLVDS